MAVIETKDLSYIYGQGTPFVKTAVDRVNIAIEEGEFLGVIGHTGSGKSTLIQMLNGLLRPTSGQILLNGEDIWKDPKQIRKVRFKVGMVFQYPEYQLFEETVYKDIAFGPRNMGLSQEEIHRRVLDSARFAGLDESHVRGHIGLTARMGLHIDVITAEKLLCSLDCKVFHHIYTLTSAIISFAGISFCIFICQGAAHSRHYSFADPVFRSDQLNVAVLSFLFIHNGLSNFRVYIFYSIQ